jgi:hypothetical protein
MSKSVRSNGPRSANSAFGSSDPIYSPTRETWIESEAFCYPNGAFDRRCRVRFPDGKLRIVRCGIPDTFFSLPVRKSDGDGFVMVADDGEFEFRPHVYVEE